MPFEAPHLSRDETEFAESSRSLGWPADAIGEALARRRARASAAPPNTLRTFYSEAEIDWIAAQMRQGKSDTSIASALSAKRGETVSRKAIQNAVQRHPVLRLVDRAKPKPGPKAKRAGGVMAGHIVKRAAARVAPVIARPAKTAGSKIVYDAASLHVALVDLAAGQCRFPVNDAGEDQPHLFCGQPIRRGSYCAHHHERATARVCEAA